jgi:hypothetical protein
MKQFEFTQTVKITMFVEANDVDEAFDLAEQMDPLNGDIEYQEWELSSENTF